jgi:hypothetical protein
MPPKPRKPSEKKSPRLLEAVKFLNSITRDEGPVNETHILLNNKTASAFNGTLGAGCIIDEELHCAPHAKTFLSALSKCGEHYTLTQLDNKLSIKSGPFKAIIPCIDPTLIYFPTPDQFQATIDDTFKSSLELIEKIKPENGQRVVTLSFLMNGGSVIATDGKILVEAWHGLNLPTNVPIPKAIIPVLLSAKKLIGFGLSSTTCTFYLDDNSFIRTQLYAEAWPDISHLMERPSNPIPVPPDFFKGFEAVKDFSRNGMVYFKDGKISSHAEDNAGAEFEVEGLKFGPVYSAKYIQLLKETATKIDFYVPADRNSKLLAFVGERCRGILMGFA